MRKINRMNKKGNIVIMLMFFIFLFVVLFIGFMMATGSAILNWVFDETVPELTNLGQIGEANMIQIADITIVPLNSLVQQTTWITGVLYVVMLVGSIGFALAFRRAPNKWLIGFYFLLVIMLMLGSIFMSNIYEEFYTGTDDLAIRLQEQTLLSFMIIEAPVIFVVVAFLTGIILFSGMQEEGFT